MADEQTIRVIRPDGKFSTIPFSSLSLAVKRGYKPAPQLKATPPPLPEELQGQNPWLNRFLDAISESMQATSETPRKTMERSRELFKGGREKGGVGGNLQAATAPFRSEFEALMNMLKGVGGVTTPVLINRAASGEDPAKITADQTLFLTGLMGGGEPAKGTLEAAAKTIAKPMEKTASGARILSQEISGAGKEPVVKAARARQMEIEKTQAKHAGATEQALKQHQETVGSVERSNAEAQAKHAEAEAAARQKWVQKAYEAKQGKTQAAKVAARKETLTRSISDATDILLNNLKSAYDSVNNEIGARYNAYRSRVGRDALLNSKAIGDSIEMARQRYLGLPPDLTLFKQIIDEMTPKGKEGIPDQMAAEGGAKLSPAFDQIKWQQGRDITTALGDKMYGGGQLPANVFKALKFVRDTVKAEVVKTAVREISAKEGAQAGARAEQELAKINKDYSQFEDDWRDTTAKVGSPLARARMALDRGYVTSELFGKSGERMMQIASRYQKYGVSPRLMSRIRGMQAELKSLPKVKVPAQPAPYEAPGAPKLKTAPEMKEIPKPGKPAPIDPAAIRRQRLEEFAGRPFRFYDLFPPYLIEHMMMKSPAFREWVASQPRQELKP